MNAVGGAADGQRSGQAAQFTSVSRFYRRDILALKRGKSGSEGRMIGSLFSIGTMQRTQPPITTLFTRINMSCSSLAGETSLASTSKPRKRSTPHFTAVLWRKGGRLKRKSRRSKLWQPNPCPIVLQHVGLGDSSVVEPTPQDTQVLSGCGFKSH